MPPSSVKTLQASSAQHDGVPFVWQEQAGEGCHLYGKLLVNKVAGNFHIAPGKSFQQVCACSRMAVRARFSANFMLSPYLTYHAVMVIAGQHARA